MKQPHFKFLKTLLAACLLSVAMDAASLAWSSDHRVRKMLPISADVHKTLQKAQEVMDSGDHEGSTAILDSVLAEEKTNDYERAVVWQLKAQIAYERNDVPATIHSYEQILTFANTIPEALELGIIYNLSQLAYSEEDYDAALTYLKRWEARIDPSLISVSNLQFMANLYYVRDEHEQSLAYINRAIAKARQVDTIVEREAWHALRISSNWELGRYDQVAAILRDRLQVRPQASYCRSLAGVLIERGQAQAEAIASARKAAPVCQSMTKADYIGLEGNTHEAGPASGEYLPIKRLSPDYPRRAVDDKVEGYVLVELTVNPDGTVDPASIKVLEAEPMGYFEMAAVKTAAQFHYKPKSVNGVPQKVTGVRYRFSWALAD